MLRLAAIVAFLALGTVKSQIDLDKRGNVVVDKGDFTLVCHDAAIELAILLDSSSSIPTDEFKKGIEFLKKFISGFTIDGQPSSTRVALIAYSKGLHMQESFLLNAYKTKAQVIGAIARIHHRAGLYTGTHEAIDYTRRFIFADDKVRSGTTKVAVVITDGNSQKWDKTRDNADAARRAGIYMVAVGVGNRVNNEELLRIAGTNARILTATSYAALPSIRKALIKQTCIRKEKPKVDINFVFSPCDLGLEVNRWASHFINNSLKARDIDNKEEFHFGVIHGQCPDDSGFVLTNDTAMIRTSLQELYRSHLLQLTVELLDHGFATNYGGRDIARKVVVLITKELPNGELSTVEANVATMIKNKIKVFVASPSGGSVTLQGATILQGSTPIEQSNQFISLVHKKH